MKKSIYDCVEGEKVIHTDSGEKFDFVARSTIGFAHIIVKDHRGKECRVYGPDYKPEQTVDDRAEFYPLPENYAVDVLAHKITEMEHILFGKKEFLDDMKAEDRPEIFGNMIADHQKQVDQLEKRIKECRDAITFIYKNITG